MKYAIFTLQKTTPEQLKLSPLTVHPNQKLDTEEGESNRDEQESTISNKGEEESSTLSDISKQNSESDINVADTQNQENSQTPETLEIYNVYSTTYHASICDEYDTSEDENITEIEPYEHYGKKIHETEESKLQKHLKVLLFSTKQYIMKMIHLKTNL